MDVFVAEEPLVPQRPVRGERLVDEPVPIWRMGVEHVHVLSEGDGVGVGAKSFMMVTRDFSLSPSSHATIRIDSLQQFYSALLANDGLV